MIIIIIIIIIIIVDFVFSSAVLDTLKIFD